MVALRQETESLREILARDDAACLQGTWGYEAGRRVSQVAFAGDRFTVRFASGDVYHGTYTLDPLHHPKAIDLHIEDGPERHRGKTCQAIYIVEDGRLVLCPGVPGSDVRPRFFPHGDDPSHLMLRFRRLNQR